MVYFPERAADGEWVARKVFTKRIPHSVDFKIDGDEFDLYTEVTRFIRRQSTASAAAFKNTAESPSWLTKLAFSVSSEAVSDPGTALRRIWRPGAPGCRSSPRTKSTFVLPTQRGSTKEADPSRPREANRSVSTLLRGRT